MPDIEPKGDVSSDVEKPSMKDSLLSSGSGKDTAPIWGATLQVYNPATQSIQLYRPVTPPPPVEPLRVVSKVKLPLVDREREVKSGSPRSPKRRGKSRKEGRRSAGEARDSGQRTSPRALTSHDTVVEAKQELDRLRRELRKERLMQDMIAEEVDRKWEAADRDTALLGDVLEAQRLLSMPREVLLHNKYNFVHVFHLTATGLLFSIMLTFIAQTRARLLSSRRSLSPRARGVEEGEEDEWDPLTHAVLAGERMVPFGFQQPPPFLQVPTTCLPVCDRP